MSPLVAPLVAQLAALALALSVARAEIFDVRSDQATNGRSYRSLNPSLPSGCLYEGRWYGDLSTVSTGEACLHCACAHGALTCRRRACAPLPDPPPHRCHILHRRGSCCPELHCPDGIILMEHGASARFENEELDIAGPTSLSHACVEGGTVYAAGSAMRSTVACEQCFCLGGTRRCVRPRCLPSPPGCRPRPASGACCPQRYYCEHRTTKPPEKKHPHDCKVEGKWITEGEKVVSKSNSECSQCFCLRGVVQCQHLACAPPLLGCKPLLRPGECCAHQYECHRKHHDSYESQLLALSTNALTSARNNNQLTKIDTDSTTKTTLASVYNIKNITSSTKNQLISTTKVKRKTSDPPPENVTDTTTLTTTTMATTKVTLEPTTVTKKIATTVAKIFTTTEEANASTEITTEMTLTEQPEGSVRIMVNGTINCTAELSSTSLPLNITTNKTEKINMESLPRIPIIDVTKLEDHTFSPNDIITDRTGNFDENESFVINVTSSLLTNNTKTSPKPPAATVSVESIAIDITEALNSSKKTKGDYDFDYSQPTLPPSLPNLKIIPFVAADAVVDDEPTKETLTYPILEREDKFPVYYPTVETKETVYPNRREDTYNPTQYPVYITDKMAHEFPSMAQDIDLTSTGYSNIPSELGTALNEYTVSASLGNHIKEAKKAVTQAPMTSTTFKIETPAINLFSPPIETEGGFIPKGPGIIDEYYAMFPSTPAGTNIPHLTTSMQLDIDKGECTTSDGRRISEGDSVTLACSECTCAWGELHCSPRPCHTPPGCKRRPASSNADDLCCGDLVCEKDNKSTTEPESTEKQGLIKIEQNNRSPEVTIQIDTPITNIKIQSDNILTNKSIVKTTDNATTTVSTTTTAQIATKQPVNTFAITTQTNKQTTSTIKPKETQQNDTQSLEYEDEEDEGFSFGSVLKLLLSDSYETTTTPPKKATTTKPTSPPKQQTTTKRPRPPLPQTKPSINSFVPHPIHPFTPPKISHNPINRIDHLVLGESTAIKKSTPRPILTTFKPPLTNRPSTKTTTQRIVTEKEEIYTTQENPRPPGGLGPGLLKLAGCNIYGRMYRVGRIITELSTPCQECWCTEFGVQCKQLKC